MSDPDSDPSVFKEPHLRGRGYHPDPSEARAERTLSKANRHQSEEEKLEHSVWEEPGLSRELAGEVPPDEFTYSDWLEKRRAAVGLGKSWTVTLAIALAGGAWAIFGALWGRGETALSLLVIVVFAPVVEEAMKTALALYVVEKKPYLFRSTAQIAFCVLVSGLTFASVENVLYLHVYIPHPPAFLAPWRWTVCVAMHMGCSLIAGLGLMRIWKDAWARRARANLSLGYPYLLAAAVIHGVYNGLAVLFSAAYFRF